MPQWLAHALLQLWECDEKKPPVKITVRCRTLGENAQGA